MATKKQHGRRRAETRGRRRAETIKPANKMMKNVGTTIVKGTLLLAITSVAIGADIPIEPAMTTASSNSVVDAASNFLSAAALNAVVTADPKAKITFEIPKITSIAGPETKHKEALQLSAAKDAEAAAYAASIAAKTSSATAAPAGAASVNMPEAKKAEVVTTPVEPTKLLSSPLKNAVPTSSFGVRVSPITGAAGEFHRGQDYGVACGTEVLAAAGGTVTYTEWHPYGGGNRVEIDHGNGLVTTYNHLSASEVKVGQKVNRGDVIALSGTTGASTGCHLHFEVEVDNKVVDPLPWL